VYTFWDYLRDAWGRDAGLRIDHLLLNPAAARRLAAAGVDRHVRGWDQASDHAPAWVDLWDAAARRGRGRPGKSARAGGGRARRTVG
jgi:exodeoxyribonuclease III